MQREKKILASYLSTTVPPSIVSGKNLFFSRRMIPTVEPLQKQGEEILPLASVGSQRQESYFGKKRDFSRWTIDGGTVVLHLL